MHENRISAGPMAADVEGVAEDLDIGLVEGFHDSIPGFSTVSEDRDYLGLDPDSWVSEVPAVSLPQVDTAEFPTYLLPQPVRKYVEEAAESIGVNQAMVAVPMLSSLGTVLGNKYAIKLKRTYIQFPILWTAVVAPSGHGKSPAMNTALAPLFNLQNRAFERATDDKAPRTYLSTDMTPEAVPHMLKDSDGILYSQDELSRLVSAFDRYTSGGGERQTWLSLWNGTPVKIDRRGDTSVLIPKPVVCVTGGVQPSRLPSIATEDSVLDGLFGRFLWCVPRSGVPRWTDRELEISSTKSINRLFQSFDTPIPTMDGTHEVVLSPTARQAWGIWHGRNASAVEQQALLSGIYGKMPNHCVRLMLVLHAVENPERPQDVPVSRETALHAMRLTEYFRAQVHGVLKQESVGLLSNTGFGGVTWNLLRTLANGDWASGPEISRRYEGTISSRARDRELEKLVSIGRVLKAVKKGGPRGGRPSPRYRLAPDDRTKP